MTPYRPPYPVPGVIWASLPLPAMLIDPFDKIYEVNPQGEIFLNASMRSLVGQPFLDRVHVDAPMEEAIARARANHSPLSINDVDVTSGERAPQQCTIHIAPLQDDPGHVAIAERANDRSHALSLAIGTGLESPSCRPSGLRQ